MGRMCGKIGQEGVDEYRRRSVQLRRNGEVRGVILSRRERDVVRGQLDRMLATKLRPRVPPHVVSLDFIEVQGGKPDLHVPRLQVCGLRGGYMVHNLREGRAGVYCRRGPGPEFTQGPLI